MEKLLLAVLFLACTPQSSFAQGEVFFANRIAGSIDGRAALAGVGKPAHDFADSSFNADLAVLSGGNWVSVPGSVTPFRGLPNTTFNGYITGFRISIPGFAPGTSVQLRMRGFKDVCWYGESAPVTVTLGGGVIPVSNLDGLQGFTIVSCPEPSTIALAILGAAALILRRPK